MSFFLLLSLFCCDIRNTAIVLLLMTYSWHFYMANKDVFAWSTFTASTRRQTRVIDQSNIERTLNRCLNSQICVWNICMEKNESKFERNEALSDLFNSDAIYWVRWWLYFQLEILVFHKDYVIMCMYCYCSAKSFCWILLVY